MPLARQTMAELTALTLGPDAHVRLATTSDESSSTLLLVGVGLVGFALLVGLIVLVVIVVRSITAHSLRTGSIRVVASRTGPVRQVGPARSGGWWRAAGRRVFLSGGRDGVVDLARFVGFVGLVALRLLPADALVLPWGLQSLVPSALVALLALTVGMATELRYGSAARSGGPLVVQARAAALARAVGLGVLAVLLRTALAEILFALAVAAAVSAFALRARKGRLAALIAALALLGPTAVAAAPVLSAARPEWDTLLAPLASTSAPLPLALACASAALVAALVSRRGAGARAGGILLLLGSGLAVVGIGVPLALTLLNRAGMLDLTALESATAPATSVTVLLGKDLAPASPLITIGVLGMAMLAVGLFRVCWVVIRWVVFPLVATGALALSIYALVSIAVADPEIAHALADPLVTLTTAAATLCAATLWRFLIGNGPAEALVDAVARRCGSFVESPAPSSAIRGAPSSQTVDDNEHDGASRVVRGHEHGDAPATGSSATAAQAAPGAGTDANRGRHRAFQPRPGV